MTIALFGVLAIVLAARVALLYVASVSATVPTVRIKQIQAAMNYAYVRIEGVVRRRLAFAWKRNASFVDDGGGGCSSRPFGRRPRPDRGRSRAVDRRSRSSKAPCACATKRPLTLSTIEALAITRVTDSASRADQLDTPDDALAPVRWRPVRAAAPYDGLRLSRCAMRAVRSTCRRARRRSSALPRQTSGSAIQSKRPAW
jgi:hypothetical protein